MVDLDLPVDGESNWDEKLNAAFGALNSGKEEAGAWDEELTAHVAATDPHGDRANASAALTQHKNADDPHGERAHIAGVVAAHVSATDPHGDRAAASSALTTHVGATDPHGDRAAAQSALSGHTGAVDPHGDRAAATSAMADHVTATDPHGDRAVAQAALGTHVGASDPHGDRAYTDSVVAALPAPRGPVWQRRNLPDPILAETTYQGTAPTITTAQTTTPTTGYIRYSPDPIALAGTDRRGPFTWAGVGGLQIGSGVDVNYVLPTSRYPNSYATVGTPTSVEFGTDAAVFQWRFKNLNAAVARYRLWVDDRRVTDLSQVTNGAGVGSGNLMKIDFGSAVPRRIRLDLYYLPFGGVYVPPGSTVWGVPRRGKRLMVLGDSISDGSAQNTGSGLGTWFYKTARLLGCTDSWNQGKGGTGYTVAGSAANFVTRVPIDVLPWAPDILLIFGGGNDVGTSLPSISTAADTVYNAVSQGLPDSQIIVIGVLDSQGTAVTALTDTDTLLRQRAAAAGLPFISPVTGTVYDGTGAVLTTQGPWIVPEQVATYIGADNVHPTDAGHHYLSRRIVSAVSACLPD